MGNKDTNIFYTTASHSSVVHFVTELLWKYSLISSLFFVNNLFQYVYIFPFRHKWIIHELQSNSTISTWVW